MPRKKREKKARHKQSLGDQIDDPQPLEARVGGGWELGGLAARRAAARRLRAQPRVHARCRCRRTARRRSGSGPLRSRRLRRLVVAQLVPGCAHACGSAGGRPAHAAMPGPCTAAAAGCQGPGTLHAAATCAPLRAQHAAHAAPRPRCARAQQQVLSAKLSGRILKAAREQQHEVDDEEAQEELERLAGGRVQVRAYVRACGRAGASRGAVARAAAAVCMDGPHTHAPHPCA